MVILKDVYLSCIFLKTEHQCFTEYSYYHEGSLDGLDVLHSISSLWSSDLVDRMLWMGPKLVH